MRAKKSLGQNFLRSHAAVEKIIGVAELKPSDVVLEIGPGTGVLTEELVRRAKKVIAVEKDDALANFLRKKFGNKLEVRNEDILRFGLKKLEARSYKLVANIPYYLTGQIFRKFLQTDNQPSKMVLMLQKEVAERVAARGGKESLLSISVKAYGIPKKIMNVPASYFSPQPKVDSAVLVIDKISKNFFRKNKVSEKDFFSMLRLGFAQKRKMLGRKFGVSDKRRAEELSLADWQKLFTNLTRGTK